ncbi:NCS2 family permease [Pontibacillus yanchengensis]|uniref:Guanine permease n=1 Tax=Pontibacillus yanchengensis Y32 TaxID=1385514 RepID=A0A0A2TAJ7_9BACI|nr:NCS2 family permease [Pontibacillus yanchengensis]KGP72589.1 guanine permease [Pontibacillus yanchengensis Y32]
MLKQVARYFQFNERQTNFRQETIAGMTTFLALAYILVVNPAVLGEAGMDKGAVFTATALTILFGTLMIGLFANYPIGIAPSMGLNAFFTYGVVQSLGVEWQVALTGVFIAAILFMILSLLKIREKIINAIPQDLKHAVAGGIGFFIAFIGLKNAGLVTSSQSTFVQLGDLTTPTTLLAIFAFIITIIMLVMGWRGAIFYGIILATISGVLLGVIDKPNQIIGKVPSLEPTFLVALQPENLTQALSPQVLPVIFTFLFVAFFDTAGTLIAIASQAGLIRNNEVPNAGRALLSDSTASTVGALLGTSTTASMIESSAGIGAGGRTGFTSVVMSAFFAAALFFEPILSIVPTSVTAPALIIVGAMMATEVKQINWDSLDVAIPAFITIIMMPLTFSVATGIALGFILYPITFLSAKRGKDIHPMMYVLFVLFIIYFWISP